jgi:hypothetical protein
MGKIDRRDHPEVRELTESLRLEHRPLIGVSDLDDLRPLVKAFPGLEFPINSAGELLDQFGGASGTLEVVGMEMEVERKLKFMPAYYFPIASMENLLEKMAELVRQNRKKPDVQKEVANIRRQVPKLAFPIESADALVDQVGADREYEFQGAKVTAADIRHRLPDHVFPIESERDFERKIGALMVTRPIVVAD